MFPLRARGQMRGSSNPPNSRMCLSPARSGSTGAGGLFYKKQKTQSVKTKTKFRNVTLACYTRIYGTRR